MCPIPDKNLSIDNVDDIFLNGRNTQWVKTAPARIKGSQEFPSGSSGWR